METLDLSHLTPRGLLQLQGLASLRPTFAQMSEEEERRLTYRSRLEASPAAFFREAWKILEPGKPLDWSWHYDYIGEYLQAAYLGQIRRLIINVPPRTSKSTMVTICWPAWCWTRRPTMRFLTASYSSELSSDHSVKRRRLIESAWFQSLWDVRFSRDTNRQDQYSNTDQGEMIATSVGATATGRGGDILILDDGLSADEAKSTAKRNTLHDWFPNTFRQRLDDPDKGVIVAIEQRTHAEDFTGWVMKNEPDQWMHLKIPLEQEDFQEYSFPISGKVYERPIGDVLQPDRFTPAVMTSRKVHVRTFATQDEQRPAPDSGIVFQREWWKYRSVKRAQYDTIITSWDFAVEGKAESDYNVGVCLGKAGADVDVIDVFRERIAFPQQQRALVNFAKKHPYASKHLVEKKANGPAIIASLKSIVSGIIAVEPQGSKLQRADAATPDVEAGNVFLIEGPWVMDFIEEMTMFPNGANDDITDAFGQGINYLHGKNYAYGLLGYEQAVIEEIQQATEAEMQRAKTMSKPDRGAQAVACPECESKAVVRIANKYRCNSCTHSWPIPNVGADPNTDAYMRK